MTRQIVGLKLYACAAIHDTIPKAISIESNSQYEGLRDIVLADDVIVKSYDNGISLDLGNKKILVCDEEFYEFRMAKVFL